MIGACDLKLKLGRTRKGVESICAYRDHLYEVGGGRWARLPFSTSKFARVHALTCPRRRCGLGLKSGLVRADYFGCELSDLRWHGARRRRLFRAANGDHGLSPRTRPR
jgi:hypothetical protein